MSLLKTMCQTLIWKHSFIVQLINTNSFMNHTHSVTLPHIGILFQFYNMPYAMQYFIINSFLFG